MRNSKYLDKNLIELSSILKYDILDAKMKMYITLSYLKIIEKASFCAGGTKVRIEDFLPNVCSSEWLFHFYGAI